jgi:6-phosphofructokinase 1
VAPIVVTSEGALPIGGAESLKTGELDAFGHIRLGGIADWLADEIEKRAEIETRSVILGHLQRGGVPTAYDRILSTRFGLHAADAVHDKDFGMMVALQGTDIVRVSLAEAVGTLKTVPDERLTEAEVFFG